jgi:hypothetical protein
MFQTMKAEIVLYRRVRNYVGCSVMVGLCLLTVFIMMILFYIAEEKEMVHQLFYCVAAIIFTLLAIQVIAYRSKQGAETILLTVSEEGLHYYEHGTFIQWSAITEIQIIDERLSVSVNTSPALGFKLNLLDTDLKGASSDLCQLLNQYFYPKRIHIHETFPTGC